MTQEKQLIEPRTLKGFRDFLPDSMIPREILIERVKSVYRSYGFAPIDTPVLEYLEILAGKGSDETDKQLYKFKDHGGRDVGLRFDLTVPFARFCAQHISELGTPFKRYHLAKVWRGENTQSGRYREFMQCDFDTIGTTSGVSDAETALVINDIMERIDLRGEAAFTKFKIHLNSRRVLNGLLDKLDLAAATVPVLRALDKLAKIGRENVIREMTETAGASEQQAATVCDMASLAGQSNDEILQKLDTMLAGNELGQSGVDSLRDLLSALKSAGVPESRYVLDVAIARGLDYYTGIVYETFLDDLPQLGSVASGGRYDNLAGLYTKLPLPGVGASLGLDRLFAGLEELGMIEKMSSWAKIFIPLFDASLTNEYLKIAAQLRRNGIAVEVYPEAKKLGAQLKYADKRGFTFAIVIGSTEFEQGMAQVKNLTTGEKSDVPLDKLSAFLS